MISQQSHQHQQQQQQHHQVLQLSAYNQHLQPLEALTAGCPGSCHNSTLTSVASASSSPSCTSPIQTQQLPAISSVINGLNGGSLHHNGSPGGAGGVTVTSSPYHQLAIIASPIVITSTPLDGCAAGDLGPQTVALQQLGDGTGRVSSTLSNLSGVGAGNGFGVSGVGSGVCSSTFKARSSVMHPSTLAYATNAYVLGTPGTATTCASALTGLEQTIDGSPLLSFSEVTNTLLNQ